MNGEIVVEIIIFLGAPPNKSIQIALGNFDLRENIDGNSLNSTFKPNL